MFEQFQKTHVESCLLLLLFSPISSIWTLPVHTCTFASSIRINTCLSSIIKSSPKTRLAQRTFKKTYPCRRPCPKTRLRPQAKASQHPCKFAGTCKTVPLPPLAPWRLGPKPPAGRALGRAGRPRWVWPAGVVDLCPPYPDRRTLRGSWPGATAPWRSSLGVSTAGMGCRTLWPCLQGKLRWLAKNGYSHGNLFK